MKKNNRKNPFAWLLKYAESKAYKPYDLTKIYSKKSQPKK